MNIQNLLSGWKNRKSGREECSVKERGENWKRLGDKVFEAIATEYDPNEKSFGIGYWIIKPKRNLSQRIVRWFRGRKKQGERTMSKITAIHGGGDWSDANVGYLVIPKEVADLDEEYKKYQKWYREVYCVERCLSADGGKQIPYMTFIDWLRANCNARDPNEDELEIFEDI